MKRWDQEGKRENLGERRTRESFGFVTWKSDIDPPNGDVCPEVVHEEHLGLTREEIVCSTVFVLLRLSNKIRLPVKLPFAFLFCLSLESDDCFQAQMSPSPQMSSLPC